jgi:glycosyltransferase involved in cell wall biosynthesis
MTPWGAEEEIDRQVLFGRTVLQIAPALDSSPLAFACVEVAAALAEAGARALVAGAPGPLVSELQARGGVFLPYAAAARNPWTVALNGRRLANLAAREGVELIHVRGSAALKPAFYAARKERIPLIAEYERGQNALALGADSVVVFSQETLDAAARERPETARRLFRGLRGVDLRSFSPDLMETTRVRRLRESFAAQPHHRLIVALGLAPDGLKLFLAAAAQLKAKGFFANSGQDARFVWLHEEEDDSPGAFEAQVARLGLTGQVLHGVLEGASEDRAAACLAAALVVLPAREAGYCVEAQAIGAPVALLQQEGNASGAEFLRAPPEVEAAMRTGWLVAPGQPGALARAAEEALRLGASARETLGRRARAHARSFSAERMCALTLSVYARHFAGVQS